MRRIFYILGGLVLLALLASQVDAQQIARAIFLIDSAGNTLSTSSEGSLRPLHVAIVDPNTDALAPLASDATHDDPAKTTGPQLMGYASATAPTNVSANADAVRLWAFQDGSLAVGLVAGSTVLTATATSLNVNCTGGCAATSITDESTFTPGTSSVSPIAGFADMTTPDSAPENSVGAIRMSLNRNMLIQIRDAAGNERGVNVNASNEMLVSAAVTSLPSVTVGTFPDNEPFNLNQLAGNAIQTGNGTAGTGTLRVTVASDSTGMIVASPVGFDTSWALFPEDNPHLTTHQGQFVLAVRRDTPSTGLGADGDYASFGLSSDGRLWTSSTIDAALPTGTNNIGDVDILTFPDNEPFNVAQWGGVAVLAGAGNTGTGSPRVTIASDQATLPFRPVAAATGGATAFNVTSAASTNATNIKNAAGTLYAVTLVNTTTTIYYLRLYNTNSAPTCSSATGYVATIPIPPAAASGQGGGFVHTVPVGTNFGTGISYCITGGPTSTDNTNAAVGIYGMASYL